MNVFLFSDDTGKINVSIGDSRWGDVSVDENDTVEIRGIITRDYGPQYGRQWPTAHLVFVESIKKL
jgi:uncharacterized protein YdeI (BOF family)